MLIANLANLLIFERIERVNFSTQKILFGIELNFIVHLFDV